MDKLFIGVDGVTIDRGLSTDNVLEKEIFRLMVSHADKVIVVTDSSKIGINKLSTILPFSSINCFITDDAAPEIFLKHLRDQNIEVITVPFKK